ncbi:hypothetical protein TNIN_71491 [Trichonephila inaurata madagascariensis]|uniref:Inorganic phosphate cotransporter n=1 Tax=Trichonephila inaurata madagascariensis TaxID=2747483 RepID=A0A8X6XEM7_9ARAC|nr:hypothetical protein TNIN_71491 [Trichonephila inaurata madagascariensis]
MSNLDCQDTGKKYKTPWKKITMNVGTWAGVVGMFGQYWITYFFLSVQPTYLGTVLHFSHIENGYLNSLPYIPQILVTWIASYASDVLVNKGYASTDIVRKVCNSLSCIGFSFCLLGVAYAGCDKSLNIICLVTALIIAGFGYPASQIVPLDMTIVFAGTLMGIVSTMASISGVIMPLIVGALTTKEQTLGQWSKVFYISAGINFTSGILFAMFGSAKLQGWDTLGSEDNNLAGVDNEAFDEKSTETCNTKPQETKNGSDMSYVIIDRL